MTPEARPTTHAGGRAETPEARPTTHRTAPPSTPLPAVRSLAEAFGDGRRRARRIVGPRPFPWGAPQWPGSLPRPVAPQKLGADYPTAWARRYPARLVRAMLTDNVTRPAVHLLASPQVRGAEHLELVDPPAIFVANHTSHLDTPLLVSVLPVRMRHRTVIAGAADYFFDRRWKAHLWALVLGAVPIERQRVSRRSADATADLLADGYNLVIFPEGGRTSDGWQQPFRGGAAYLSVRTGCPVVPVHLSGTGRLLPKEGARLRRSPTTVTFGTPMAPRPEEDARRFATRIEAAVAALAVEDATDWWDGRRHLAAGTAVARAGGPQAAPWRRAWAKPLPADRRADPERWAVEER